MKTKKQKIVKQLITNLIRTLLVLLILFGFEYSVSSQKSVVLKNSSGFEEIDQILKEIKTHPTDESNYEYRGEMLSFWESFLRQQGATTAGRFTRVRVNRSNIASINKEQKEEIARYAKLIDKGYLILDSIQN